VTTPPPGRRGPLLAAGLLLAVPLGTALAAPAAGVPAASPSPVSPLPAVPLAPAEGAGPVPSGDTPTAAQAQPLPAAAAPAGGGLGTPLVSGLPWRSGATGGGFPCLAQLRGRPLDAITTFVGHRSFPAMVQQTRDWQAVARQAPLLVVSLPLLPEANKRQFAQCAAGAFDGSFRQIGANLRSAGAPGTVVRLGWEANIGSDSHPWGVDSPAQVPAYRACFRRAAAALKAGGPGLAIEWTNAKKTANRALSVEAMYPGGDAVDVIGVHYYDTGPRKSTQAVWDRYYKATYGRNPWGLGAWLDFARAHGKRLGVAEWGLWRQGGSAAAADDPVYVDNMARFFRANAGGIAYETYFNAQGDQHMLCPSTRFPRSAARYRAGWGH
jgi:hypothetical protein